MQEYIDTPEGQMPVKTADEKKPNWFGKLLASPWQIKVMIGLAVGIIILLVYSEVATRRKEHGQTVAREVSAGQAVYIKLLVDENKKVSGINVWEEGEEPMNCQGTGNPLELKCQ